MNKLLGFADSFDRVGIHTIKLRHLLELRDPANETRQIKTMFPPIEIGSITLVDQITLLSLIELANPERILEIGTYQGYSTRLFVDNSSAKEVVSIDLPPSEITVSDTIDAKRVLRDGNYNDDYLRSVQAKTGTKYLADLNSDDKNRIRLMKCDSTKLDFRSVGHIQFAFIDGGHSFEIVKQDTINVLKQIKSGVVVWHDYSSSIHSDVTDYLGRHSAQNQLFYVQGGLCVFQVVRGD